MPFTLSHPAAVLPFVRRPFSAAALVAGAVAPDLPYFARSTPVPVSAQSWYEPFMNATTSHSLVGAVTVSLPYALLLYGFLLAARRPVGGLLPGVVGPGAAEPGAGGRDGGGPGAGGRSAPRPTAGVLLTRSGWVLLSLVIGIATHLVWDSFTHGDGYVVTHVPLLSAPAFGDLSWARLLQHVSTVVGLVVIAVYLWRRRGSVGRGAARQGTAVRRTTRRGLWAVAAVAVVGAVLGTVRWWSVGSSSDGAGLTARDVVEGVLSDVATGAGAALIAALLLYVAVWWAVRGVRAVAQG
ncbi:DUF4184 family protein [Promicromonospora sukumoe]|uniref:DUF4184 family protein n=1 Tax=Promicromonospora sukumoe TaxID=88382 RepID=UPI0036649BCE